MLLAFAVATRRCKPLGRRSGSGSREWSTGTGSSENDRHSLTDSQESKAHIYPQQMWNSEEWNAKNNIPLRMVYRNPLASQGISPSQTSQSMEIDEDDFHLDKIDY